MEDITYTVQPNDTLYKIAKKFNTSVKQIMELNNLHNTILLVGQILIVGREKKSFFKEESYQEFLRNNQGQGKLKVHTLIGDTNFPISSTKIEIYKYFNKEKIIFFTGYTEESGQIDNILLPSPIRQDNYQNGVSTYQLDATHNDFKDIHIDQISIYDGIKSIQKIEMMPKDYIDLKGKRNDK